MQRIAKEVQALAMGVVYAEPEGEAGGAHAEGLVDSTSGKSARHVPVVVERKLLLGVSIEGGGPEVKGANEALQALGVEWVHWTHYAKIPSEQLGKQLDRVSADRWARSFGAEGAIVLTKLGAMLGIGYWMLQALAIGVAERAGMPQLAWGVARGFHALFLDESGVSEDSFRDLLRSAANAEGEAPDCTISGASGGASGGGSRLRGGIACAGGSCPRLRAALRAGRTRLPARRWSRRRRSRRPRRRRWSRRCGVEWPRVATRSSRSPSLPRRPAAQTAAAAVVASTRPCRPASRRVFRRHTTWRQGAAAAWMQQQLATAAETAGYAPDIARPNPSRPLSTPPSIPAGLRPSR